MGSKLCAILFFFLLPITAMAAQEIKVGVSVDCDLPTSLLMSAYNNTSAAIEISEAMLPWNYSKVFHAQAFKVSEGRSTELVRVAPPANYLRQITFAPHQALGGEIKLDNIFVGFPSENERSDIIVFYRIRKLAGDKLANFEERSGAVFFPKKSFFGDNCPVLMNPHL